MLKRGFDLCAVLLTAPLWVPLLAVTACLVAVKLGRPVFFRQPRPGWKGKIFEIVKLRSMTSGRDERGELLPDHVRLTAFGRWLRATSLDELPELWNVLRGEMSLVGPRPLRVEYLPRYNARQARRHDVRPGITGWAQVNGRNGLTWEEKFEWDVRYVESAGFWLDLKILGLTLRTVFSRSGVSAPGEATMAPFEPEESRRPASPGRSD